MSHHPASQPMLVDMVTGSKESKRESSNVQALACIRVANIPFAKQVTWLSDESEREGTAVAWQEGVFIQRGRMAGIFAKSVYPGSQNLCSKMLITMVLYHSKNNATQMSNKDNKNLWHTGSIFGSRPVVTEKEMLLLYC